MKLWKHTLITAFAFFGISTAVLYTSCEKDTCADLKCRNGGSCAEGFCRCPSGYEGTECEQQAATKFLGRYIGHYSCPDNPPILDTVDIWLLQAPNKISFVAHTAIADTLTATVNGTDLNFDEKQNGNYKKYNNAELMANKISVFTEETFDPNTNQRSTCSFIGFK